MGGKVNTAGNMGGAKFRAFRRDERGATAIEYALIGSLISIVIVGGAMAIGGKLTTVFQTVSSSF